VVVLYSAGVLGTEVICRQSVLDTSARVRSHMKGKVFSLEYIFHWFSLLLAKQQNRF